jgi:hypothetical protein
LRGHRVYGRGFGCLSGMRRRARVKARCVWVSHDLGLLERVVLRGATTVFLRMLLFAAMAEKRRKVKATREREWKD